MKEDDFEEAFKDVPVVMGHLVKIGRYNAAYRYWKLAKKSRKIYRQIQEWEKERDALKEEFAVESLKIQLDAWNRNAE